MGTCKVLIDGAAEGVRECVEIMFKRGQIIVIRLRSLLAAAGHNPDDYIPLVDARERKGGLWEEKNYSPPPGGAVKKIDDIFFKKVLKPYSRPGGVLGSIFFFAISLNRLKLWYFIYLPSGY